MNVRIATIPTSEPTIPLTDFASDSRRVLHLNSLTILVVKTIYTLRVEPEEKGFPEDKKSWKSALLY